MQKVAIVGLPNVGKSTLFNRLVRRKSAIVSNIAHITRDRNEDYANLCGLRFVAIDTGGVSNASGIQSLVTEQVRLALQHADLVLFVVDSKKEMDSQNADLAKWLRKHTKLPVVLVVNKCESTKHYTFTDALEYLGFLGPVYISAEHNLGMADLYEVISPFLIESVKQDIREKFIAVSIIGQPNVGKSTFVNRILGENRMITDATAGTTRDSVRTVHSHKDISILLTDTAGIRKKTKIVEDIEKFSIKSAINAVSKSSVVILMVDFTLGISQQDLSIASTAIKGGKSLILALNKSDLVDNKDMEREILNSIQEYSKIDLEVPMVKISALQGKGCTEVLDKAIALYEVSSSRISTAKLNKWLYKASEHHTPAVHNNRKIRLKYITQIGALPPTFLISSNSENVDSTYQQYLRNSFIHNFSMQGVPVRMIFRKTRNPYV